MEYSLSMLLKHHNYIKTSLNNKGLSMIEILISIGAMGFFAILVQSMLIVGHSFTKSQENFFDSIQINKLITQKMCMSNNAFKNINLNQALSYKTEVSESGGVHSREYKKINSTNTGTPLLGLTISNINGEDSFKDTEISPLITYPTIPSHLTTPEEIEEFKEQLDVQFDTSNQPTHYKVYQDSHTIVKLNFDSSTFRSTGAEFISGYIFASRCIENDTDSAYKKNNQAISTFSPDALKKSAFYILKILDHKPYYFPSSTGAQEIQCCTDGSDKNTCSSNYIPRIYVLHIDHEADPTKQSPYSFTGKVAVIQEFPELHELNNIWGMGFMLSTKAKQSFNTASFQLDIMALKNKCITSTTYISKCQDLVLGTDPLTQKLTDTEGITINSKQLTMGNFINPNISSCTGYSSGIDTSSLIDL